MTRRDGILILDSEGAIVVDTDPFLTELLGYERDELVGRPFGEAGLLADQAHRERLLEAALRDGYVCYRNLPLKTRDGRGLLVDVVGISYLVNDSTVIQLNVSDVTDRAPEAHAAVDVSKDPLSKH